MCRTMQLNEGRVSPLLKLLPCDFYLSLKKSVYFSLLRKTRINAINGEINQKIATPA